MTDVFISYARAQAKLAAQVAERLQAEGFEVWWDSDLPAHRAYSEVIEERLLAARAILVLWSKTAARSEWVRAEADVGRAHHKLVQASADGGLPPLPFNQIQVADLARWNGSDDDTQWRKVLDSVRAVTGGSTASASPPRAASTPLPTRLLAALKVRPRLAAGAGLALLLAVAAGLWMVRPGAAAAGSGATEVARFTTLQADPVLQRASVAASDAAVRSLTTGGLRARMAEDAPAAGPSEFRITGTIDRDGADVVIDARILDRTSGQTLWSGHFEGPAADAQHVATEAGFNVAVYLHCALTDRAHSRVAFSGEVMSLYLGACEGVLGPYGSERMLSATHRLVASAPDLAAGWAMHGIALARVAGTVHSQDERRRMNDDARAAAAKAIALDPLTPKAYLARALTLRASRDWPAQERDLRKALDLEPNLIPARLVLSWLLRDLGRTAEALEMDARIAESSDPRATGYRAVAAPHFAAAGDLTTAAQMLKEATDAPPDEVASARYSIAVWWDNPGRHLSDLAALAPRGTDPREVACFNSHLQLMSRANLPHTGLPAACDALEPADRMRLQARQGDLNAAYAFWASTASGPPPAHTGLLFSSEMRLFRFDPRFIGLARQLGLAAYWRSTGHWPDFCSEPGLPYDCRKVF